MTEIQIWLLALSTSGVILSAIALSIACENGKGIKCRERYSNELSNRIGRQRDQISTLEYIITGDQEAFNIHAGIPNPNMGVMEIQKRVELILDKLGVEVDEGARLVEGEGE